MVLSRLIIAIALSASSLSAMAQPVTTVITHGQSFDGEKGAWIEGMANAIVARAGGAGAILRYRQDSGAWQRVRGNLHETEPAVLIFRWLADFQKAGPNLGFAEGAADALYAALRDPRFVDENNQALPPIDLIENRHLHLIGHSRGAVVNSEAARRFAAAGIAVDHITALDPHPMNGTLDPPINFDWGDDEPQKWDTVAWADNYWRADGGFFNAGDPDGMPLQNHLNVELDEDALECCGYNLSHSDVHLWYHGTIDLSANPCDGEMCISDEARQRWWTDDLPFDRSGFFYSRVGGGADERPAQPPGIPPGDVESLYNGDFTGRDHSGWLYHGGQINGQIVDEGGETFLKIGSGFGPGATHNRFLLPADAGSISFDYRVFTASPGESIVIAMRDADGNRHEIGAIAIETETAWVRDARFPLPTPVETERRYTLTVAIVDDTGIESIAGIDNVEFLPAAVATITGFEIVTGTLLDGDAEDLSKSDDARVHTRSGFGSTLAELHKMEMVVSAVTTVDSPARLDLSIESFIDELNGSARIRLFNWNSGSFDQVGQYPIGTTEETRVFENIDAEDYVNGSGDIDFSIKHLVFVPFLAFTFESFVDWVEIVVE